MRVQYGAVTRFYVCMKEEQLRHTAGVGPYTVATLDVVVTEQRRYAAGVGWRELSTPDIWWAEQRRNGCKLMQTNTGLQE